MSATMLEVPGTRLARLSFLGKAGRMPGIERRIRAGLCGGLGCSLPGGAPTVNSEFEWIACADVE